MTDKFTEKEYVSKYHYCANPECMRPMLRAEWITGDYCWACRLEFGNWKKPTEVIEKPLAKEE